MYVLTLLFNLTIALGGLYLAIGLGLHLVSAWQSCAAAIATRNPGPFYPEQSGRSELEALDAWDRRFGLT